MAFQKFAMFTYFLQFLSLTAGYGDHHRYCKLTPGSKDWPRDREWTQLNKTLSGQLIKPVPPGGVCHPTYPTYDPLACPAIAAGWLTNALHAADPVSSMENNWNNDTCLPVPTFPCSGAGYPVYVINATKPEHVKKGIDFARKNNIRLIVKGTGHDYLGRSSAPNSLSIWTHHMKGLKIHDRGKFRPKRCRKTVDTAAITAAAGVPMLELDEQANLRKLVIVSGGAGTVGLGGYLTGGGHGAISPIFGLAADQVLEIELVTPGGDILTANECQNQDLFWAMRGGGGSTFGVMTSVTIRAFPSFKYATATALFGIPITQLEPFWDAMTTILSCYPSLADKGISAYSFLAPNYNSSEFGIPFPINGFLGTFNLPLIHPENSSETLIAAIEEVLTDAKAGNPLFFSSVTGQTSPDFWTFYKDNNGPQDGGSNQVIGSRLLDGKALTSDKGRLKEAIKGASQSGGMIAHLISGKGVHHAKIAGGSNAVNPAFRKAYVHAIVGTHWNPLDTVEKAKQERLNTHYVDSLRKLAPDSGAYVNEADPNEPNFQQSFWGDKYPRLLKIKKRVDPKDVLWCIPCVGNEGWKVIDDVLCKI